jgi:hypothetical protein
MPDQLEAASSSVKRAGAVMNSWALSDAALLQASPVDDGRWFEPPDPVLGGRSPACAWLARARALKTKVRARVRVLIPSVLAAPAIAAPAKNR